MPVCNISSPTPLGRGVLAAAETALSPTHSPAHTSGAQHAPLLDTAGGACWHFENLEEILYIWRMVQVPNFPFPTPPERGALAAAEGALAALGALGADLRLTPRGRAMAALPITPRHSRMLLQVPPGGSALPWRGWL